MVYDALMAEFARRQSWSPDQIFTLPSYMSGFQVAMSNGKQIDVTISNIRPVTNLQFDKASKYDNKKNSLYFVSGDILVTGDMNFSSKDLFCIRKGSGKISQIGPYQTTGNDNGESRDKVVVNTSNIRDWDHIADGEYNAIGASYGYSSRFPMNVAINANFSYFDIGFEYGKSSSDTPLDFVRHTNYATSTIEGDCYYLMATPGVFLHWVSVSCGLGSVFTKYRYESIYSSYDKKKNTFIIKPKLTVHIPVPFDFTSSTERVYVSPYVGYVHVPKFTRLNCWEAGIGVRIRLVN